MGIRFSRLVRTVGVGLYIVVTRVAMTIAVIFTALFFILNSRPFPDMIAKALVGVIPGYFEFGRIQVSPVPWIVDVTDVAINTPRGKSIITVDLVRARIKLVPLLESLIHLDRKLLKIHFASVRLDGFNVLLQFDTDYHLELVDAFDPPGSSPPNPDPVVVSLEFDRIFGSNGRVFLEFPEWDLRIDGIDMKVDMGLVTSPIDIVVKARYFNWLSGIATIRAGKGIREIPRRVVLRQGFVDEFEYAWDQISFGRFRAGFDFGSIDASDGFLSWGKNLKYSLAARLEFPGGSHAIETASDGIVSGPLSISLAGRGDASDPRFELDLASPALKVAGLDLGRVDLSMSGGRDEFGLYRIGDVMMAARGPKMRLDLTEGEFNPATHVPGEKFNASCVLDFSGVDVSALLEGGAIDVRSPAVPIPGVVEGSLKIGASAVQSSPVHEGAPAGSVPTVTFKAAGRVAGALSRRGVLDGRTFVLDVDGEYSFRDVHLPAVSFSRLRLRSGNDNLSVSGMVDFSSGRMSVSGFGGKELAPLEVVTGVAMKGYVELSGLSVRGRLRNPEGFARVKVSDFAMDRWKVFQASGGLALGRGRLSVGGLKAAAPFGQFAIESVVIPLSLSGRPGISGPMEFSDISVAGLDLGRIPVLDGTGISGFGHARARFLSFSVNSPKKTISSRFSADFDWLMTAGRRLRTVSVQGMIDSGVISGIGIDGLVEGGGSIGVSGRWNLVESRMDISGSLNGVPLKVLAGFEGEDPVSGKVSADLTVLGNPVDPEISGWVKLDDPVFRNRRLASVQVQAERAAGGDLLLSSDRLFGDMRLAPGSAIAWKDGGFRSMKLDFDIRNLTPQDVLPDLPARKLAGGLTARLVLEVPSFRQARLIGRLESPPGGLWLEFFNRQARLENRDALSVRMEPDGRLVVSGVRLDDGQSAISVCGVNTSSGVSMLVSGNAGLHWLRALRTVFSSADGVIEFAGRDRFLPELPEGCGQSMLEGSGAMLVSGSLDNPVLDGTIRTGEITLNLRSMGDPVRIDRGGWISFTRALSARRPVTDIHIPDEHWISGVFGEGVFNVSGRSRFDGGVLDSGTLRVKGSQIRYVSAGEFFIVAEPALQVDFKSLRLYGSKLDSEVPDILVGGQVDISDGAYHRNFNVVRSAFSGMTGSRVAERAGRSFLDALPWLGDVRLNLAVRAPSFGVRTRLVVGQTDLDLNVNLRLLGTLRYPEIWDRVEVVSGGSFTYDVVRREFEVARGVVDFDGDMKRPRIDLQAKTRVEYKAASSSVVSASRFNADDSQDSFYSDMIQVNLGVSGTYPELDIQVTSPTRGLSQNDLQMLLLTGMAPGDSIGDAGGSFVNVNLLTGSVTDSLVKVLLADLVDSVSFGVSAGGDVNLDVSAHMGRRLKIQTQVQQGSGSAQYSTGFKIRLTDGLSLEGRLRAVEYSVDQEDVGRNYDTKLRYRIPIE